MRAARAARHERNKSWNDHSPKQMPDAEKRRRADFGGGYSKGF